MTRIRFATPLLLASLAGSALAVGPTSTLYITNYGEFGSGNTLGLDLVQGASESSYAISNNVDICIACAGDVRTMGYGFGDAGSRFDLNANPLTGGPYVNGIQNSQLHDGTSDGNYNYSVNYTTGDVIQFDRSWASPVSLFSLSTGLPGAGWITMNAADGSFWVSQWGGGDLVQHLSHTGTLLGSFNSGVNNSAGLAFDPADGTLWMGDWQNPYTLHQFSQGGALLQSETFSLNGTWYGMEFDETPVPEPASIGLLGAGFLAVLARTAKRGMRSAN